MIPLVIGAIMLFSGSSSVESQVQIAPDAPSVEEFVRVYYAEYPVLAEIAKCESRFRQFDKDGHVLRGEITPLDVGVMQINEGYHKETSVKLGYDIQTVEGNLAYAKHLFDKQGTKPWKASSKCWKASEPVATK